MNIKNRSTNSVKNVTTGLINKFLVMFLSFVTKTVFIRYLGAEYNGISSLYTNILSVLSLAELGIGNVLMFYLYSALKNKNEDKICKLVNEFKKIYSIIIVIIIVVGLSLVPFLKYIINSKLNHFDLILYYLLYLVNSIATYFVVHRTTVIIADQKSYISNTCSTIVLFVMYGLQLVYLITFHDFLGYLIIQVICTIINNLILNNIACKQYPFLRKRINEKSSIINKSNLFKNIKATFLYKLSETILDQTDSIIISIMFGTVFVGLYSNYYMIVLSLVSIASILANGLLASFGNLNADGNMKKSYSMFKCAMLLFSVFGTLCTACYACIIQDFIPLWVGKNYIMSYGIVIAILSVFYLRMITNTMWMYRSSMGLFKEVQYINVISAIINIILSVILGKLIGIAGVIVATAISRLVTSFWYEGKVLFNKFSRPVSEYYLRQLRDFCISLIIIFMSFYLSKFILIKGIIGIIIKLIICGIVTFIFEFIFNYKSEEFKILKSTIIRVLKKNNKYEKGV